MWNYKYNWRRRGVWTGDQKSGRDPSYEENAVIPDTRRRTAHGTITAGKQMRKGVCEQGPEESAEREGVARKTGLKAERRL